MPSIRVNGIDLWYESRGSGAPLLLIHGLGSSGLDWEPQVADLARDYRVITLDLRGHGRSRRPPSGYSVRLFASDVAGLLDALKTGPVHMVGLSLGGCIAFQLSIDRPDLVHTMVIINSGPYLILDNVLQKFSIWWRLAVIRIFGLPRLGKIVSKRLFPNPAHAALRSTFAERFAKNDRLVYEASLKALVGWSVRDRLGVIRAPTLILAADQDYTPVEMKQAYVPLIPGARLEVIPNAHHDAPMECPERVNAMLRSFLQAQEKQAAA